MHDFTNLYIPELVASTKFAYYFIIIINVRIRIYHACQAVVHNSSSKIVIWFYTFTLEHHDKKPIAFAYVLYV